MEHDAKIKETAKQVAALLAKSGVTCSEVSRIFDEAAKSLYVVPKDSGVIYRNGRPYERKPYAKEYTPVDASDDT